jgi:hypothetical protein
MVEPRIVGIYSFHEGKNHWLEPLNVGNLAFHEGRGAGKKSPPGGHDLVSGIKIVNGKEKLRQDKSYRKEMLEGLYRVGPADRNKHEVPAAFCLSDRSESSSSEPRV